MAAFVILMAALLVKHSIVSTFRFLVSEVSVVKGKISLLFEISRYFFPSHEDYAIIPNKYDLKR